MRIRVDEDICIGSGLCSDLLPVVFGQGEDGTVILGTTMPEANQYETVRTAALRCPSGAISLDEESEEHSE